MKKICSILLISLLFVACTKKPTVIVPSKVISNSYLPNGVGSNWTYQLSGFVNSSKTITCSNRDTVIAESPNLVFDIMEVAGGGQEFQSRLGDDYYITVPNSSKATAYKVIKGDAAINEKWIGAINGTDTYYVELLEKGITYIVDTATFTNVLHVKQTRVNGGSPTMNLDTWVAYNYGIIQTQGSISGFAYNSRLTNVEIK
jgi:hypothetical protein